MGETTAEGPGHCCGSDAVTVWGLVRVLVTEWGLGNWRALRRTPLDQTHSGEVKVARGRWRPSLPAQVGLGFVELGSYIRERVAIAHGVCYLVK